MNNYETVLKNIADLRPYENNARTHSENQIKQIAESINEFGFTNPLLIDEHNNIIAGHGRLEGAQLIGLTELPCVVVTGLTEERRAALVIADNKLALNAGWDIDLLATELQKLTPDLQAMTGFSIDELGELLKQSADGGDYDERQTGAMASNFGWSPFTVFNARAGEWQARKDAWSARGIDSGQGRPENLIEYSKVSTTGKDTSIFDPVLCELMVNWYSKADDLILDPFSGGSVRGLVSHFCRRRYIGADIRAEQTEANQAQATEVCTEYDRPVWITGDSANLPQLIGDVKADMILSCPPYLDLENYSDDPGDLSNMSHVDFIEAYRAIIKSCYDLLEGDRFAVWVVGEVRNKKGNYCNFLGDTIRAFIDAGFEYYNEAVLITMIGSLPLRTGRSFKAGRKLGKTHQNVLVFVKGDWRAAAERLGDVYITEIEEGDEQYGEVLP